MKLSLNFLQAHVQAELKAEELSRRLTFAGAEVEGIERLSEATGLVVGKIIECEPHPNSDHLHVLQVDEGPEYGVCQIVCGAPNARKGLSVIVARPEAKLPGLTIKPTAIRGVESLGMCCALYELGVDKKYLSEKQLSGIEELPDSFKPGDEDVLAKLGYSDVVLDMDLLPNRPDLYSLNNVIREVACLYDCPYTLEQGEELNLEPSSFTIGSNTPKCPSFKALLAYKVKIKESPIWLKSVLMASGIRPINNVVDIGNYVMLVTGQPLNMYDLDKLKSPSLTIEDGYQGSFKAMDGREYKIEKGDLLVCSAGEPSCLAGIMTAESCMVDGESANIAVEAASFDGASIRRTSARIGLSSDSSLRFVKGVNPLAKIEALKLVKKLFAELCDCSSFALPESQYGEAASPSREIEVSLDYLNSRLGTSFSEEEVLSALKRDGFEVLSRQEGRYRLLSPSYRLDIEGKADVSEEVIRLLGLDKVESSLPVSALSLTGLTESQKRERTIRRLMLSRGYDEVLTYTLVSLEEQSRLSILPCGEPYVLENPLTVDRSVVRTALAPSLLSVLSYNAARQQRDGAVFEISDVDDLSGEGSRLGVALTGKRRDFGRLDEKDYDFFDLKGAFEDILGTIGIAKSRIRCERASGKEGLHPGRSALVYMGKDLIAYLGEVHPKLAKLYDLPSALVMEVNLKALLEAKVGAIKANPIPRFPMVTRDLSFILDDSVSFAQIEKCASCSPLIKRVEPFDVYKGPNLPEGKKAVAISLTLLDESKTLTDAEVASALDKVIESLGKLGAEIRK